MLYNVRIFGKRYINKTKEDAILLLSGYAARIEKESRVPYRGMKTEIICIKDTISRLAFYGNDNKIIVSLNKVKAG